MKRKLAERFRLITDELNKIAGEGVHDPIGYSIGRINAAVHRHLELFMAEILETSINEILDSVAAKQVIEDKREERIKKMGAALGEAIKKLKSMAGIQPLP